MDQAPVRRRGRYAEAERNDAALLEAARDVFAAQGFDAPVSAVADRAGVGIGSLYRRYTTKEELLQALSVLAMRQVIDAAATALADPDAWSGFAQFVRRCVAARSGALGPLAGRIATTDEMWRTNRQAQESSRRVVRRAQEAGVVRSDINHLDLSVIISRFSRSTDTDRTAEGEALEQRMVTLVLEGFRPRPDAITLPGKPPTRRWYEAPWQATAQPP